MNLKMRMKQLNKLPIPIKRAMSVQLAAKHPVFWNAESGMIEPVREQVEPEAKKKTTRKRKKKATKK